MKMIFNVVFIVILFIITGCGTAKIVNINKNTYFKQKKNDN